MNICLSFLQSLHQHPIPAYDFWPHYLKNGIAESGHEWSECIDIDWAAGLVPSKPEAISKWRSEAWEKMLKWLKKHPADLFLSYLYPHMIDTSAITEIRRMGIPCVNFFCDHLRDFKKLPAEFSVFDQNWVPEYQAVNLYQQAQYPYIHLPMPMWVEPKYRQPGVEKNNQVTFIGSKDIQRQLLLEKLVNANPEFPVTIYGRGWLSADGGTSPINLKNGLTSKVAHQVNFIRRKGLIPYYRKFQHRRYDTPVSSLLESRIGETIDFDAYNSLTSGSRITLGINRYPSFQFPFFKPHSYSRLRDIEAPMLGACYLTEWTEGIEHLYEPGKEIETYSDEGELAEKIKALTTDAEKRKLLRINGQKKALSAHSITASIDRIICKLH